MNYLLDTHVVIWFLNGDKTLSNIARKAIESESASNFISIASLWEIAIKISLNRLSIKVPFEKCKFIINRLPNKQSVDTIYGYLEFKTKKYFYFHCKNKCKK